MLRLVKKIKVVIAKGLPFSFSLPMELDTHIEISKNIPSKKLRD